MLYEDDDVLVVNKPTGLLTSTGPKEKRPTLMIDEADTFLQGNDELRGVLNAGYHEPSAYVIRVSNESASARRSKKKEGSSERLLTDEGDSPSSLATYSTWCPKFIAAIGHLPETLADRCIVIRMQRKRGDEECERTRNLDPVDLRKRCAQFALEHRETIAGARADIPKELNDRAADIWEPLFVIADIAGGDWPAKARAAAVVLTMSAQENSPTGALLFDIGMTFFSNKADRLFTQQLLAELNSRRLAGRPWAEGLRGKPATETWLAEQLRPFGVRPKLLRLQDRVAKGYEFSEMEELFNRYVPESELENWKKENMPLCQKLKRPSGE